MWSTPLYYIFITSVFGLTGFVSFFHNFSPFSKYISKAINWAISWGLAASKRAPADWSAPSYYGGFPGREPCEWNSSPVLTMQEEWAHDVPWQMASYLVGPIQVILLPLKI